MRHPAVLYISYDGMLEPLGQSQVIAYLERLASDVRLYLVSYEKPADLADAARRTAMAERLVSVGIVWHPLTYHKHPTVPATLFDIAQGLIISLWLTFRHNVRIVHARSYVPALIGRIVKLLTGAKLLFDMRGLWADERVDGGIWAAQGRVYRTVKRLEQTLLLGADHIVTLTHASKALIEAWPNMVHALRTPMTVIPTCADLDLFTPAERASNGHFTLGYVGSAGTRYQFDEVLHVLAAIRRRKPDTRLLVVNRNDHALIAGRIVALGIDPEGIEIIAAELREVPQAIRRMDCATAFYKPAPSAIACAPTKLAEYLGCGVPCLGNIGVGDIELILDGEGAGVTLRDFTPAERERAIDRLLALAEDPATPAHCRAVALKHFSVKDGAERYREIYRELAA
jgi:glycosyltransferase involved in cell wall biosynthesis